MPQWVKGLHPAGDWGKRKSAFQREEEVRGYPPAGRQSTAISVQKLY